MIEQAVRNRFYLWLDKKNGKMPSQVRSVFMFYIFMPHLWALFWSARSSVRLPASG